jgi:hypothetical protein
VNAARHSVTPEQLDMLSAWAALPADEREEIRLAIAARAALRREETIEIRPVTDRAARAR